MQSKEYLQHDCKNIIFAPTYETDGKDTVYAGQGMQQTFFTSTWNCTYIIIMIVFSFLPIQSVTEVFGEYFQGTDMNPFHTDLYLNNLHIC